MDGLIFETSIWLLAGSTRFVRTTPPQLSKAQSRKGDTQRASCSKNDPAPKLKTTMHPLAAYLFNSEGKTEDLHSRDLSVQTLPEKPAQLLQNFNTLNAPQRVQIHKLKLANLERWFKSPTFIINLRPKEWRFTGISKGKCQLTGKQRGTSLRIQKHTNW